VATRSAGVAAGRVKPVSRRSAGMQRNAVRRATDKMKARKVRRFMERVKGRGDEAKNRAKEG
jgi:hypothetical protein